MRIWTHFHRVGWNITQLLGGTKSISFAEKLGSGDHHVNYNKPDGKRVFLSIERIFKNKRTLKQKGDCWGTRML